MSQANQRHYSSTIRKLYAAANAVFSRTEYVSDVVKLSLIDAYCDLYSTGC